MSVQTFKLCQFRDGIHGFTGHSFPILNAPASLEKRIGTDPARKSGGGAGGKAVTRARKVVARGHGRLVAEKEFAAMT